MALRRTVSLLVLLGVLTACGQRSSQPATATATAEAPPTVTAPAAASPSPAAPTEMPATAVPTTAAPPTATPLPPTPEVSTSLPPAATPTDPPPGSILGQHTVQQGETLSCIGRAYAVLPSAIAQANGISTTAVLAIGQVLAIPAARWTGIAPGPVCAPQFSSPFVGGAPTPTPDVPEAILILEPGNGSAVVSPVRVAGEADPTFEQSLVVEISDEDGDILATVPAQITTSAGQRGPFAVDVAFSVPADQAGRISVYSTSARDGGLIHLASVEVTLRADGSGSGSTTPVQPRPESIIISSPAHLGTATGGRLALSGFSDYVFEAVLNVTICGEGGSGAPHAICGTVDNVIASDIALVQSPDIGQPGPFEATIAYTVAGPVRGRVAVYSLSARDGGLIHLASREVTLQP